MRIIFSLQSSSVSFNVHHFGGHVNLKSFLGYCVLSVRSSNCAAVVNICGGRRGTSIGRTCSSCESILYVKKFREGSERYEFVVHHVGARIRGAEANIAGDANLIW